MGHEQLQIRSVGELLALSEDQAATLTPAAFVGPGWATMTVRNAVLDARGEGGISIEATRKVLPALLRLGPVEIEKLNSKDQAERFAAQMMAFGGGLEKVPSPLLALSLLTVSREFASDGLGADEWAILAAFSMTLVDLLRDHREFRPVLAMHVGDVCRTFLDQAAPDMAMMLAEQAGVEVRSDDFASICALPDVLEAVYDARTAMAEIDPPIDDAERRAIAEGMLKFLREELGPAVERRESFRRDSATVAVQREIRRNELALRHRIASQEASRSTATTGWDGSPVALWVSLADEYESLNDREGQVNGVRAVANAIDGLVKISARVPSVDLRGSVRPLVDRLDARLESVQGGKAEERDLRRRLVQGLVVLGDVEQAEREFGRILASLHEDLALADASMRSSLLSNADDLLGLALHLPQGVDGPSFRTAFQVLRSAQPPSTPACMDSTLRAYVTRTGSYAQLFTGGDVTGAAGVGAHDLALTLNELGRLTRSEVKTWQESSKFSDNSAKWKAYLERLAGRLGLAALSARKPALDRIVLEVDGLGVHLASAGAVLTSWPDVSVVAATRLGFGMAPATVPAEPSVLVLNCFEPAEGWSHALAAVTSVLGSGTVHRRVSSGAELAKHLQEHAAGLIIMGAHGLQDAVAGALKVSVGGKWVGVEDLLAGIRLPLGSTVLAATCFAASGRSGGDSPWLSLPELLLHAGARWVVAHRWHAWTEPATAARFHSLVTDLRRGCTSPDPWIVPEATTRFMRDVRAAHDNPRQWAGWTAWTSRAVLGGTLGE